MNMKAKISLLIAVCVMSVLVVSGVYVEAQNKDKAITAQQTISCINTAIAARAGMIENIDIEREGGRIVCEVEIVETDGRDYNVVVDVVDNKVIRNVEDR